MSDRQINIDDDLLEKAIDLIHSGNNDDGSQLIADMPTQESLAKEFVTETQVDNLRHLVEILSDMHDKVSGLLHEAELTTPIPENIGAVEHLDDILKLEYYGFEGLDEDLSTSLHEYGLVWRRIGPQEMLFIYPRPRRSMGVVGPEQPTRYHRVTLREDEFLEDYDWVDDWDSIVPDNMELEEWHREFPFPSQVYDLLNWYGPLEIFGQPNWEGFTIQDPEDPKYLKFINVAITMDLVDVKERRKRIDSRDKIIDRARENIPEFFHNTCPGAIHTDMDIDLDLFAGSMKVSMKAEPDTLLDCWPYKSRRMAKAIVSERVGAEVDMILKDLEIGSVQSVCPSVRSEKDKIETFSQ